MGSIPDHPRMDGDNLTGNGNHLLRLTASVAMWKGCCVRRAPERDLPHCIQRPWPGILLYMTGPRA